MILSDEKLHEARARAEATIEHWRKLSDPAYVLTLSNKTLLLDFEDEAMNEHRDHRVFTNLKMEILSRMEEQPWLNSR